MTNPSETAAGVRGEYDQFLRVLGRFMKAEYIHARAVKAEGLDPRHHRHSRDDVDTAHADLMRWNPETPALIAKALEHADTLLTTITAEPEPKRRLAEAEGAQQNETDGAEAMAGPEPLLSELDTAILGLNHLTGYGEDAVWRPADRARSALIKAREYISTRIRERLERS